MTKVLVVATSRKTRGGITSVVKAHETGEQWKKYHCRWIETHRDGPAWRKIWYFIKAYILFFFMVPFCDLVHIHVASYSSLKRKRHFLRLAKLWRKRTIAHFHPHKPEVVFEKRTQKEYYDFFNAVDTIIVLSPQWKRWIIESLIEHKELELYHLDNNPKDKLYSVDGLTGNGFIDKIQIVYNPCPTVERGIPDHSKKYILFAGTIYYRKGFDTLIKAFGRIAKKYPDWKVIIAGNPKEEKDAILMRVLPKELDIEDKIEYPGWVIGEEKERLFRNCSIFCLASYQEGFPMAVLDAWAYGIPCVVTPAGGIPDIAVDGKNVLMFEYGDDKMLAKQLDRMMSDEKLRTDIAKESIHLSDVTFNVNNINRQIGDIYKSIIGK